MDFKGFIYLTYEVKKFKEGDTVIYIGKDLEFAGKIGTIFSVFANSSAFVSFSDCDVYTSTDNLKIVHPSTLDTE